MSNPNAPGYVYSNGPVPVTQQIPFFNTATNSVIQITSPPINSIPPLAKTTFNQVPTAIQIGEGPPMKLMGASTESPGVNPLFFNNQTPATNVGNVGSPIPNGNPPFYSR
jgi:hypothetical protein